MAYQSVEQYVVGTRSKTCKYTFTIDNRNGGNMSYATYLRKLGQGIKTGIIDRELPTGTTGKMVEIISMTGFANFITGRIYVSNSPVRIVANSESFNNGARYSQLFTIYSDLGCISIMETFTGTACNFSDMTNNKAMDAGIVATITVYYRVSDIENID